MNCAAIFIAVLSSEGVCGRRYSKEQLDEPVVARRLRYVAPIADLSLFDLTGTVALVTGSSRGLGLVLARGLARAGAEVVLNGRAPDALAAAGDSLRALGLAVHEASFDVREAEGVEAAVATIEREVGAIGCLVNNAGLQDRRPLDEFPPEAWQRLVDVNLTGAFLVAQAVARRMIERGRGKIVNVCSVQSELARQTIAPYAATKGGLKMLTRGMCADWARHGIQANALAPGYFATELTAALTGDREFTRWLEARTPAGRWGDPEELVGATVFLASRASDFVNGQIVFVDGGLTAVV
jgi:gluconate 5-dehydrogenase